MSMFDPGHHQRMEYWADRVTEHTRHGEYSTAHLRLADALWHFMETSVKVLTFPIWWPISKLKKRGRKTTKPAGDPYTTDLNRPLYK